MLALGIPSLRELEARLTPAEIEEWHAYSMVEPFGSPADDERWRLNYSLFYAVNSKEDAEQPDWLDRMPEQTVRLRRINDAHHREDKVAAQMEAYFTARMAYQEEQARLSDPDSPDAG